MKILISLYTYFVNSLKGKKKMSLLAVNSVCSILKIVRSKFLSSEDIKLCKRQCRTMAHEIPYIFSAMLWFHIFSPETTDWKLRRRWKNHISHLWVFSNKISKNTLRYRYSVYFTYSNNEYQASILFKKVASFW